MMSKTLRIITNFLHYNNKLDNRKITDIELLIIHCTELPDMATARQYGEKIHYAARTGNSGHFYIDTKGDCEQWVALDKIAHHVKGHNKSTVGIELVNLGRYPDWFHSEKQTPTQSYPIEQVQSLIKLILQLQKKLVNLKHIAGHEDLDTRLIPSQNDAKLMINRKIDPGPLFPWDIVMQNIQLINIGSTAKKYE